MLHLGLPLSMKVGFGAAGVGRRVQDGGGVQRGLPRARGVGVPHDVRSQKQNRRQGSRHHSGRACACARSPSHDGPTGLEMRNAP